MDDDPFRDFPSGDMIPKIEWLDLFWWTLMGALITAMILTVFVLFGLVPWGQ